MRLANVHTSLVPRYKGLKQGNNIKYPFRAQRVISYIPVKPDTTIMFMP